LVVGAGIFGGWLYMGKWVLNELDLADERTRMWGDTTIDVLGDVGYQLWRELGAICGDEMDNGLE
jgi:hypothetical protein